MQAACSHASCQGWAGSSPAIACSSCQRHYSSAGEMGTAGSCPQPGRGWGPGGGYGVVVHSCRTAASAHFCPSCPHAAAASLPPLCGQPPCPTPAAAPRAARLRDICSLPRAPRQPLGGSPRASQELMLQMMPLICQLLNPAQAPAEVCLNSGNCTNMVLFLPRAKPYSSCITLCCFLKLLLAQSRAGLVQRRAARAGLLLLAPVTPLSPLAAGSLGHPPAQTLVPAAAAGDGCPALEDFDAAGHRVPPM